MSELKNLTWFMEKYKVKKRIVVYNGREESIKIKNKTIFFYPISKLLFNFKVDVKI